MCVCGSSLDAQDWAALQALPSGATVRIRELGGRGGEVSGRIQIVEDAQVTLVTGGKPVIIPRAAIARIEQRQKDPVWEGMLFGAIYAALMTAAFKDDSWTTAQTSGNVAASIALGAFIDYRIQGSRTIYVAPQATVTFLRLSF